MPELAKRKSRYCLIFFPVLINYIVASTPCGFLCAGSKISFVFRCDFEMQMGFFLTFFDIDWQNNLLIRRSGLDHRSCWRLSRNNLSWRGGVNANAVLHRTSVPIFQTLLFILATLNSIRCSAKPFKC